MCVPVRFSARLTQSRFPVFSARNSMRGEAGHHAEKFEF